MKRFSSVQLNRKAVPQPHRELTHTYRAVPLGRAQAEQESLSAGYLVSRCLERGAGGSTPGSQHHPRSHPGLRPQKDAGSSWSVGSGPMVILDGDNMGCWANARRAGAGGTGNISAAVPGFFWSHSGSANNLWVDKLIFSKRDTPFLTEIEPIHQCQIDNIIFILCCRE